MNGDMLFMFGLLLVTIILNEVLGTYL